MEMSEKENKKYAVIMDNGSDYIIYDVAEDRQYGNSYQTMKDARSDAKLGGYVLRKEL